MNGWIDVWRSQPNWAAAFDRRADPLLQNGASGFDSDSFEQPRSWSEFDAEMRRVAMDSSYVVHKVTSPDLAVNAAKCQDSDADSRRAIST